jgi:hypothetical protein
MRPFYDHDNGASAEDDLEASGNREPWDVVLASPLCRVALYARLSELDHPRRARRVREGLVEA